MIADSTERDIVIAATGSTCRGDQQANHVEEHASGWRQELDELRGYVESSR